MSGIAKTSLRSENRWLSRASLGQAPKSKLKDKPKKAKKDGVPRAIDYHESNAIQRLKEAWDAVFRLDRFSADQLITSEYWTTLYYSLLLSTNPLSVCRPRDKEERSKATGPIGAFLAHPPSLNSLAQGLRHTVGQRSLFHRTKARESPDRHCTNPWVCFSSTLFCTATDHALACVAPVSISVHLTTVTFHAPLTLLPASHIPTALEPYLRKSYQAIIPSRLTNSVGLHSHTSFASYFCRYKNPIPESPDSPYFHHVFRYFEQQ